MISRVDRWMQDAMVGEYAEKMQIKCDICMRSAEPRSIAKMMVITTTMHTAEGE